MEDGYYRRYRTTNFSSNVTGGATNDHTMVVTFGSSVIVTGNPQAQVTMGTATIGSNGVPNGGMVTVNGNVVTIPLTLVANAQTISVRLNGVNGGSDAPATDVDIPMSALIGDTNANRTVNAADVAQTKARLGQADKPARRLVPERRRHSLLEQRPRSHHRSPVLRRELWSSVAELARDRDIDANLRRGPR